MIVICFKTHKKKKKKKKKISKKWKKEKYIDQIIKIKRFWSSTHGRCFKKINVYITKEKEIYKKEKKM
jgi:hypothetical protein